MALETPTWLNLCFVEKILRKSEGDNSIQVIDIFSKPATNKGDNYTSDMIRVNVEFSREQGDCKTTEKKSIIVKIAPIDEGARKEIILKARLFEIEMLMMTDTLDRMNKLLAPKYRLSGKGLYVQKENPMFIVIEDLTPLGFRMADRLAGLDLDHCLLAIRGLAKFHASSVAVCEQDPSQKQTYRRGMFSHEHPTEMRAFFYMAIKTLADEITKWPEVSRYAEKISKFTEHIYRVGAEISKPSEDEFNVINHGDCWVNNMLFKYDNGGKPIDHIFVDFQLCVYASPALDIHYFLSTSPSPDVIENSKSVLLNEYHNTLVSTMQQLNCKTQPPTMEELKATLKRKASFGMIAAFTVLPIVLCNKDDVKDLDEMMGGDSFNNEAYSNEAYRKVMTKRIPLYDEWGLLDV
ncbi:uncharacterized protein [Linepithema humile]|nr:PREDICTED: uncharacterized protein LOC105675913 isoform X2 [Linepithema humile]XP_012228833.1 PREDICTED: uncharacterized protein LOC105675913 isoform X2 [Linepithema humile]XP_012228834.1 PREDICTED: uncharacterized protein LOC105675913 isoform X2 [Linepithema humile]